MSKKFTFVGGTTRGTKIDWPVEVRAFAIAAKRQQGLSAKEAFAAALVRLNEIREAKGEAAIVDLPKSYTGKYAGSLMYGVEQRFLKQLKEGDAEHKTWAEALSLEVQVVETPDETVAQ